MSPKVLSLKCRRAAPTRSNFRCTVPGACECKCCLLNSICWQNRASIEPISKCAYCFSSATYCLFCEIVMPVPSHCIEVSPHHKGPLTCTGDLQHFPHACLESYHAVARSLQQLPSSCDLIVKPNRTSNLLMHEACVVREGFYCCLCQ